MAAVTGITPAGPSGSGTVLTDEDGNPIRNPAPDPIDFDASLDMGFDDAYIDDEAWLNDIFNNLQGFDDFEGLAGISNLSRDMLSQVFNQSMNGSIASYDTAANRLRERLDRQAGVERDQFVNQNLGSGFQGAMQNGLGQITQGKFGALSEGLVGLSDAFENRRLQGLNIGQQAASSMGTFDLGKFQSTNSFNSSLNQTRANAYDAAQKNRLDAARTKIDGINEARRQKLGLAENVLGLIG